MEPVDPRVHPSLVPEGSRALILARDQPEYLPLPCIRTPYGHVITSFQLDEKERRRLVEGEDIYLTICAWGPVQPVYLSVGPVNWRE